MEKKLAIIIKTYQDFIRTADENTVLHNRARLNAFFDAISDSYIPLLNMLGRLEQAGTEYKLGLVVPPVLCAMLDNPKSRSFILSIWTSALLLEKKKATAIKTLRRLRLS